MSTTFVFENVTSHLALSFCLLGILSYVLYTVALAVYRLYLHPLGHVPGPWLAATSGWYEFYYDVIIGSAYFSEILELHKQYGPLVRIAPNHVHVSNSLTYKKVYGPREGFVKAPEFWSVLGIPGALVAMTDPKAHRIRRNIMNPAFTAQAASRQEPQMAGAVLKFVAALERRCKDGSPVNIQILYRKLILDSICETLFGGDLGLLESPEEYPVLTIQIARFLRTLWFIKHVPGVATLALNLPLYLAEIFAPGYASFRKSCSQWITDIQARRGKGVAVGETGQCTVFDLLLDQQDHANGESTKGNRKNISTTDVKNLVDDAFVSVIAGSESTTITLAYATYHLLQQPEKVQQLRDELKTVPKTEQGTYLYAELSRLPYLSAIVSESLRICSPVPGLLPRTVPAGGLQVGETLLPAGTVVSVGAWTVHNDPDIFPQPQDFDPERWLRPGSEGLEQWLVPFSKGPRQCIGKNLAYMQLYLSLAETFTRFDMSLYETDKKSMEWYDTAFLTNRESVKVLAKPIGPEKVG